MRKTALLILNAGLVCGGVAMVGCDRDEPDADVDVTANTTPATRTDGALTEGERVGDVGEMIPDSVYEVLAEATEAAVKDGGFDDLVERFAENDRARFAGIAEADFAPLDNAAKPLREAYEGKYGGDFDINDPKGVFRGLVTLQPKGATDDKRYLRVKFESAPADAPPYDIMMVKDVNWHIDIADHYDRESLRDELVRHLGRVGKGGSAWPADKLAAQRLVAYHVLAALANSRVGGIEQDTPGAGKSGT